MKFLCSTKLEIFIYLIVVLVLSQLLFIPKSFALAPINVSYILPPTTSINYGVSSAMHCDLDGDGTKDVVITDYKGIDPGTGLTQSGRIDIYWGGTSLSATPDIKIYGEGDSRLGDGTGCGDFNGDGIDDLSAGAVKYTVYSGRNYVFYGRSRADWALITHSVQANVIVTGETTNSRLGNKSAIGDINGDGKGDLLIGAEYSQTNRGRAYVVFGRSDTSVNIVASAADIIINNDLPADVSALGDDVSIGDVSGDSIPDILISVGDWLDGASGQSRAIVFNGSPGITTGTVNASTANSSFLANSDPDFDGFGYAIRNGDVNGDGRGDLIVGADHVRTNTGKPRMSIIYGPIPTGAYNIADIVGTDAQVIVSESDSDLFSMDIQVADVNNDEIDDIITSAAYYSDFISSGRLYVFFGGSSISEKTLAAEADYKVHNPLSVSYLGWWVSVGDINNDGWAEFGSGVTSTTAGKFCIFSLSHVAPTVTLNSPASSYTQGDQIELTGTATDPDSGNIVSVEYSIDGGNWQEATASLGSFDSSTEDYTFSIDSTNLDLTTTGEHTVSVRATDSENATTASADYASAGFSITASSAVADDDTVLSVIMSSMSVLPETGVN